MLKREAFRLLEKHYHAVPPQSRAAVVQWLQSWAELHQRGEATVSQEAYDALSMLAWLARRNGDKCDIAEQAYAALQEALPEKLSPWPYPHVEMHSLSEEEMKPSASECAEIDTSADPHERVKVLLATLDRERGSHRKDDYIMHALAPAWTDTNWAIEFQEELLASEVHDKEIWSRLFQTWREQDLTPKQWERLFDTWLRMREGFSVCFEYIADLLAGRMANDQHPLPEEVHELASQVASHCWKSTATLEIDPISDDVVFFALNRSPGELAHFWLKYAQSLKIEAGQRWAGFPVAISRGLHEMLAVNSERGDVASILLCRFFDQVYYLDSGFAEKELLPKFDFPFRGKSAVHCWQAYLESWGRWPPSVLFTLLPSLFGLLEDSSTLPEDSRLRAADHAAWLSIYRVVKPLEPPWLPRLIPLLNTSEKLQFCETVANVVLEMHLDNQNEEWRRWISEYWRLRAQGVMDHLGREEATAMLSWCFGVGTNFPEAISMVTGWDCAPIPFSGPILTQYDESPCVELYPTEAARFLTFILDLCGGVIDKKTIIALFSRLKLAGADEHVFSQICHAAIKHGISLNEGT